MNMGTQCLLRVLLHMGIGSPCLLGAPHGHVDPISLGGYASHGHTGPPCPWEALPMDTGDPCQSGHTPMSEYSLISWYTPIYGYAPMSGYTRYRGMPRYRSIPRSQCIPGYRGGPWHRQVYSDIGYTPLHVAYIPT